MTGQKLLNAFGRNGTVKTGRNWNVRHMKSDRRKGERKMQNQILRAKLKSETRKIILENI